MKRALAVVLAALALSVSVLPFESEARDRRCRFGRNSRTQDCGAGYAFFEFAPTTGAGMTAACACAALTGARGEVLSFTRSGSATCNKSGTATTGINSGDLVSCANSNEPRVEPDVANVLGLRVENTRTNSLLQFIAIGTAVTWTDVATPTLTTGQASPWTGTYATSAVLVDDNDGLAYEGRSQSVTVSAGAAYTMSCYVKAGTATTARISLDGTAQNISGLSTSTWSLVSVTDASSSSTSIAAQVLVGNATTDTGTVTWGGCQVEAGSYATSMIPTTTSAATRNAETGVSLALSTGTWPTGSAAMAWTPLGTGANAGQLTFSTNGRALYGVSPNILTFDGTNNPFTPAGTTAGVTKRYWSSWSAAGGWVVRNETDGNQATSAFNAGTWSPDSSLELTTAFLGTPDGIYTRVCLDPDTTRCR